MNRNLLERAVIDEVRQERQELESLLEAVQGMFHEHRTARVDGAARLLDCLDELREHLGMMFALQETDGYLDELGTTQRALGDGMGVLKAEHVTLFEGLSRMIEQCDRDVARGRWGRSWKLAEMTFENFCERLQDCQASEVVQPLRAFNRNAGVGD